MPRRPAASSSNQAPSDVAQIEWVQELYPSLVAPLQGAWEILSEAADADLVLALRESETHGLDVIDAKRAGTIRARLLSEKDCDGLYSYRVSHVFRMAHTLAPAQAAPLIRAALAAGDAPTHVLALAFEHVFAAAEADEAVSTLVLPTCKSEYEAYAVGEALAPLETVSTGALERRAKAVFEPAGQLGIEALGFVYALFACAQALLVREPERALPKVRKMIKTTASPYVKRCLEDLAERAGR